MLNDFDWSTEIINDYLKKQAKGVALDFSCA